MQATEQEENKLSFLLKYLTRGLLILSLFILAFLAFKQFNGINYLTWLEPVYSKPALVFAIYTFSEVFFGLITPEIFMAWGLNQGGTTHYILILLALMLISYGAGWLNYLVGLRFRKLPIVRWFLVKRMKKYVVYLKQYGGFLLVVAAVTPLPYAAICLLSGATNYPMKKFLLYTTFRLLRYTLYGYAVFTANKIDLDFFINLFSFS
ncbi:hypothetical protein GC194_14795 [bacterium]|nr:hypothetical protein [bacterium]